MSIWNNWKHWKNLLVYFFQEHWGVQFSFWTGGAPPPPPLYSLIFCVHGLFVFLLSFFPPPFLHLITRWLDGWSEARTRHWEQRTGVPQWWSTGAVPFCRKGPLLQKARNGDIIPAFCMQKLSAEILQKYSFGWPPLWKNSPFWICLLFRRPFTASPDPLLFWRKFYPASSSYSVSFCCFFPLFPFSLSSVDFFHQ